MEGLFEAVVSNPKFLYSSFYGFTNQDVVDFFERAGVPTKIERGGRVFPVSDHSSDVIRGLERELKRLDVEIRLNCTVKQILADQEKGFFGFLLEDGTRLLGDAGILATGGLSYPSTGSTGDGLRFAEELGHQVTECLPGLVPMECKEPWVKELQGLSLRNVRAVIRGGKKVLYEDFGEMLFTHYGVSGPLMLTASSYVGKMLKKQELLLEIDLKPALDEQALDKRLLRDFEKYANHDFCNALDDLLPQKLIPVAVERSGIPPHQKVHDLTREQRRGLMQVLKHFSVEIAGPCPVTDAIVTSGGVKISEIDPKTMESKIVKGLYFSGEIMDVDAYTGGFNLQIAWATGRAAGQAAAEALRQGEENA